MIDARHQTSAPWCIVVADAAAPTWRIPEEKHGAPVQYCCFGQPTTMLQKALHRAIRVSEAGRVMVTAAEAHRSHWEGPLWYVRPEHRFVSACPGWSALTTASAVLWIAARAPLAKVTILPARCYVADEWTLTVALHRALYERPLVVDEIVTLGMTTDELALDEDYLMTRTSDGGLTSSVTVSSLDSRRWATRELARKGALIASDIYIGHASTFAALFYSYWPILTHALLRQLANSLPPRRKTHPAKPAGGRTERGTAAILGPPAVECAANIQSEALRVERTTFKARDPTSRLSRADYSRRT
jgi:mannose-1-phosphate guanylyltransferase